VGRSAVTVTSSCGEREQPEASLKVMTAIWRCSKKFSLCNPFCATNEVFYTFPSPTPPDLDIFRFWRISSSGMLRRVALVRIDVSEECIFSIISVTKIGDLRTTLSVGC
jgi:hypothetical protein